MEYKVNISGSVKDENGFKCGFDILVENGSDVEQIGSAVQKAIDDMAPIKKK